MRLELTTDNRLGITHEVLAVLVDAELDVRGVEVETRHIYLNVPALTPGRLPGLAEALKAVPDVHTVEPVDLLPTERRRMQLHAMLAAMDEPALAIERSGAVAQANEAAITAFNLAESDLRGSDAADVLGADLISELTARGFTMGEREITVGGETYLMQTSPIRPQSEDEASPWGGLLILHRPARLGRVLTALKGEGKTGFDTILGDSEPMRRLRQQAKRLAAVDAPLLILGETGTGKELLARACHRASSRKGKPFLALNCAAIPEGLAESELFGHSAGAFTGALRTGKPGILELSDSGTVLLDEIGELSPYLQAKLLRFLADGTFRRVGGTKEVRVDVRVISATNRNLEAMSRDGEFREDLYFRLNVLNLRIPPLRERGADILELARHFVATAATHVGRDPPELSERAETDILAAPWPGNVRELENTLFRAVTLCDGPVLERVAQTTASGTERPAGTDTRVAPSGTYADALADFEKRLFKSLLPDYPSSRKLAKRLGVSHTTVAQKLKRYGFTNSGRLAE